MLRRFFARIAAGFRQWYENSLREDYDRYMNKPPPQTHAEASQRARDFWSRKRY